MLVPPIIFKIVLYQRMFFIILCLIIKVQDDSCSSGPSSKLQPVILSFAPILTLNQMSIIYCSLISHIVCPDL